MIPGRPSESRGAVQVAAAVRDQLGSRVGPVDAVERHQGGDGTATLGEFEDGTFARSVVRRAKTGSASGGRAVEVADGVHDQPGP